MQPEGYKVYPNIPPSPEIFNEADNENHKAEIQAYSIIAKLNRMLAVAGEYGLTPIFIDNYMASLFIKKLEIAKMNTEENLNQEFYKNYNYSLQKVQYLLHEISKVILPNEILEEIPEKELIIARNNTIHELYKLRRKLEESINFLSAQEFGPEFLVEVERYIKKELIPQTVYYSMEYYQKLVQFLKLSVTFTAGAVGATIGLNQALSPTQIAFYSGISAIVGSVVSDLAKYIVKERTKKYKNTFSYFLNFRD